MFDRRHFVFGATAGVSAGFLGLRSVLQAEATAGPMGSNSGLIEDPAGILSLPPGFSYRLVASQGEEMADGLLRPGLPDGMATFSAPDGRVILICNHELSVKHPHLGPFGKDGERIAKVDPKSVANRSSKGVPFNGGTTTGLWNPTTGKLESQFMSLIGTDRNCAGGTTPWGSWITCEEPENLTGRGRRGLGYNYEVPAKANGKAAAPHPLKAMGRFRHEAVAVDPKTGVVYETEDRDDGIFYRFLPEKPGDLTKGGQLQALRILDQPSMDLRNWKGNKEGLHVGSGVDVEWVDIENVESPKDDLRHQGFEEHGAARFARAEGCLVGEDGIYFICTSGGKERLGQIWRYRPSPDEGKPGESKKPGRLELFLEPNNREILRNGDNIAIAPWGDLVICEDAGLGSRVLGVTPEGRVYTIAANDFFKSEFAGACFAPNHPTLFVNIQFKGTTYAITGPWEKLRNRK